MRKMSLQGIDPGSLDQRSTDWATEAVAVSLGASSVYIYTGGNAGEVQGYIKDNIWNLHSALSTDGISKVR